MATKVEFINPFKVRVEAENGDIYTIGYHDSMNYKIEQQWDGFFTKCLTGLFDKHYDGNEETVWGAIQRGMFLNRLNSFDWVIPHRDKDRVRIGNRIKELRKEKKIDAKELAQRVGIDPGNLSRIEQGKFSVGVDTLNKIARAMNMSLDFVPQINLGNKQ